MKMILSVLAMIGSFGASQAQSCPNQALACRIADASSRLQVAADANGHIHLSEDSWFLYDIASDFCACDYSEFTPGSGVLMQAWRHLQSTYRTESQPASQAEQAAYANLSRQIGQ